MLRKWIRTASTWRLGKCVLAPTVNINNNQVLVFYFPSNGIRQYSWSFKYLPHLKVSWPQTTVQWLYQMGVKILATQCQQVYCGAFPGRVRTTFPCSHGLQKHLKIESSSEYLCFALEISDTLLIRRWFKDINFLHAGKVGLNIYNYAQEMTYTSLEFGKHQKDHTFCHAVQIIAHEQHSSAGLQLKKKPHLIK